MLKCLLMVVIATASLSAADSITFGDPATTIHCNWIAKHNGGLRYEQTDGRLSSMDADQMKYIVRIEGKVLASTPVLQEVVHTMHCSGGKCSASQTMVYEKWPEVTNARREDTSTNVDRLPKPLTK